MTKPRAVSKRDSGQVDKVVKKRPVGRPPTPEATKRRLMDAVCARVAKGELVKYAAQAEGTSAAQIREWGLTDEFSTLYTRARVEQAHAMAEQAIDIADGEDPLTLFYEEGLAEERDRIAVMPPGAAKSAAYKALAALESNLVQRDRMRMDARKWLTSKIAPKLYGEKLDVTSDGEKLPASQTIIIGGQTVQF